MDKLVYGYNQTDVEYPKDKTIQELFEKQAEETPNNVAVVFEDKQLTYRELNRRANQLAYYIRAKYKEITKKEMEADTLIALCLDRSLEMIIAILGVLKAGGAYVPMDPSYPEERIRYILEDIDANIVITQKHLQSQLEVCIKQQASSDQQSLGNKQIQLVTLGSEQTMQELKQLLADDLKKTSEAANLAYVIYTSGTTGKPKGVMIEHRGVVNLAMSQSKELDLVNTRNIKKNVKNCLWYANYVFDAHVWEIYATLLNGHTSYIVSNDIRLDIKELKKYIQDNKIDVATIPPVLLNDKDLLKLDILVVAGDKTEKRVLDFYHDSNVKVVNAYGPTETTVCASLNHYNNNGATNIGKPILNTQCYVLDNNLFSLPAEMIGELYIGGAGLARGYLNHPELTAERFIANPFQTEEEKKQNKNSRLYKTGDLVRWLPDGNIEYIGRNDFQVKIRGFRIELGEIENALSSYAGIKQSVVLAKEHKTGSGEEGSSGNKYLVGYYVADNKLEEEQIIKYLNSKLPEYMVPSILVYLEKLPLTVNGKLDRKALPEPEFVNQDSYVAPRNELEQKLCAVWEEVLGLPNGAVGIQDDFFRLGGNSILAIRLVSKLSNELNDRIGVVSVFKNKTIKELVEYLSHAKEDIIKITPAKTNQIEEQVLSFAQERLWFIDRYEQGTNAYNIPMVFNLSEKINLDVLEKSIRSIVNRHEILRTLIKEGVEGNGYQLVLNDQENPLEMRRIRIKDQSQLDQEISKEVNHVYDLDKEYPIRVCIYQLGSDEDINKNKISIVIHHIAFDGWSVDIFLKELHEYYRYYLAQFQGSTYPLTLSELTIQYKDFAIWQRNYLTGERLDNQLAYWKNKLEGYEGLQLITDKPRPNQIDYSGKDIYFELDEDVSRSLRDLAKELKVSLYSLLLSGYCLMLRSYSGQDEIVIGAPVANRHYNQIENLIGFFVNSLALRVQIDSGQTIKEYIQGIGKDVIDVQLHQDLPFEKLVEELNVVKDTSRHPIFQIMFGIENFGNGGEDNLLQSYNGVGAYEIAKFDISTFIDDSQTKLRGSFNYATSLYTEEAIGGFIETYKEILKQLAKLIENSGLERTKISDINYLTEEEYEKIIHKWNATDKECPKDKTIQDIFEEQVEKTQDNIAVEFEDKKLTYCELNQKANQLACYLRKSGAGAESQIGLFLERSELYLIGMLGILKAGGAFVPFLPTHPESKHLSILQQLEMNIVITTKKEKEQVSKLSGDRLVIVLEEILQQEELALNNLANIVKPHNLAYIIFTSGSTGLPKGAMIEHEGMLNHLYAKIEDLSLTALDNVAQLAPQVFDISIWQYLAVLLVGGRVTIFSDVLVLNPDKLIPELEKRKVTILECVPGHIKAIVDVIEEKSWVGKLVGLKWLLLTGEALPIPYCNRWFDHYEIPIINAYGPTECSDDVTHFILRSATKLKCNYAPISGPIINTKIYILDRHLNPVPIGVMGELCVGGAGVGRGYLNRPDLTAEKFILNPFATEADKAKGYTRLYRTGDLSRWLPNGNIEYIGRNDFQVKIRGFRIELGEIENALSSYEGIKQSAVLAKEHKVEKGESGEEVSGNKYLVGYYVADNKLKEEQIIKYLNSKLPEYMMPSILVHLEKLPLTVNGKLDRKALPEPEFVNQDGYVAPRNELEKKLCIIWEEVLGLHNGEVGIQDDFFRLGGDSISSIILSSKMRKAGLGCSVKDIFEYRTVSKLAKLQERQKATLKIHAEQGALEGEFSLLPVQEWFFEKLKNNEINEPNHFNQSFIIRVPELDIERLREIIPALAEHHDILRVSYEKKSGGEYKQIYNITTLIPELKLLDISKICNVERVTKIHQTLTQWQQNFDIEKCPLWQIGYIYGYEDKTARIYFASHHLIIDAVSWRILLEDIKALYNHEQLSEKTTSYRQWVEIIKGYVIKNEKEKCYWEDIQRDQQDYRRHIQAEQQFASVEIDYDATKQLISQANNAYNTEINDLLLTALAYALKSWNNSHINHITLEGHGREHIQEDIELSKTVGWFTTIYPVKLEVKETLNKSIKFIKENLREIPRKGLGYGSFKYNAQRKEDQNQLKSLPPISFNYLGQFDSQEGLWQVAGESSGQSVAENYRDSNIIDINGMVIAGKLRFSIVSKFPKKQTQLFAQELENYLKEINLHCLDKIKKKQIESTPSDFGIEISQELLDALQRGS